MPDQKMMQLCAKISVEKDSQKLVELVEELNELLAKEHDTIKHNINLRLNKGVGASD
jgi:hypothetical protein